MSADTGVGPSIASGNQICPYQRRSAQKAAADGAAENRGVARHQYAEVECLRKVRQYQYTDEEEHIGKTRHDKCFLRSGDGCRFGVVEADEQV